MYAMDKTVSTLDEVKALVAETLGIEDRIESMDASTGLLGQLPELDSMAVVMIATEIENRFGFEIDNSEFTAEVFETLGTLAAFVDANRPLGPLGGPIRRSGKP
jgi:acyl carrier protein